MIWDIFFCRKDKTKLRMLYSNDIGSSTKTYKLCDNINDMPIDDKEVTNINTKAGINDYSPYHNITLSFNKHSANWTNSQMLKWSIKKPYFCCSFLMWRTSSHNEVFKATSAHFTSIYFKNNWACPMSIANQ